jgi:DNA primase
MQNQWVDYRHLKDSIGMTKVFEHYGLSFRQISPTDVRGHCPLPVHQSQDSKDSFGASIARDIWSCLSETCVQARGGKKGGNVLDFVAWMENCSIRDAALKLSEWFSVEGGLPGKNGNGNGNGSVNEPLLTSLEVMPHLYTEERGIKAKTAKLFGIGYYTGDGVLNGRIVIPIHNESGDLIGYCGRGLNGDEPRYLMPVGFRKSLVLFNLHRAAKVGKVVILVEGFFGCMKLHQAGYPNAAALMGSSMSESQEELLLAAFDYVILMMDGDDAGRRCAMKTADRLVRKVFVRMVDLPEGMQPDQLPPEEIDGLLSFLK